MDTSPLPTPCRGRAVTRLAMVTLLLGGLRIVGSLAAVAWIVVFLDAGSKPDATALETIGFLMLILLLPVLLGVAALSILAGILLLYAGVALRRRPRSGRTLTLVLGTFGGILAALYGVSLFGALTDDAPAVSAICGAALGVLVHGGYCALVFVVLLDSKNRAEFA